MQADIAERVMIIIAGQFGMAVEDVRRDANLAHGLEADSPDLLEITMWLENEFGIEISNEDAEKIETVQHAIDLVRQKV